MEGGPLGRRCPSDPFNTVRSPGRQPALGLPEQGHGQDPGPRPPSSGQGPRVPLTEEEGVPESQMRGTQGTRLPVSAGPAGAGGAHVLWPEARSLHRHQARRGRSNGVRSQRVRENPVSFSLKVNAQNPKHRQATGAGPLGALTAARGSLRASGNGHSPAPIGRGFTGNLNLAASEEKAKAVFVPAAFSTGTRTCPQPGVWSERAGAGLWKQPECHAVWVPTPHVRPPVTGPRASSPLGCLPSRRGAWRLPPSSCPSRAWFGFSLCRLRLGQGTPAPPG